MSKVILVANCCDWVPIEKDSTYIGIDKGSLLCLRLQIPMQCAIGDFDSISNDEYQLLSKNTEIIRLPKEKDMVDSEYALRYAESLHFDEIDIYGVIGSRMDHFLVMYRFLETSPFAFTICDQTNRIYRLDAGVHEICKKSKYISVFPCKDLKISLKGMKYPLHQACVSNKDCYLTSNEIVDEKAIIEISGRIIVMETNDIQKKCPN